MNKTIIVKLISKSLNGGNTVSPICDNARYFCKIARKDELDDLDLFHIGRLGFDIKYGDLICEASDDKK